MRLCQIKVLMRALTFSEWEKYHKSTCELSSLGTHDLIRTKLSPKSSILKGCYGVNLGSNRLIFEFFDF